MVLGKSQGASRPLDVQQVPQINDDGRADGDECEQADVLDRDVAREGEAGKDKPLPPLPGKRLVAQLVEPDVAEQTAGHGEDEGGIEQNQASLADVSIVEENKTGRNDAGRKAVAGLPHDQIDNGNGQGSEESWERAEGHIGNLVRNVGIANVLEKKVAIIAYQPAGEREEELAERGMDVEEVCLLKVVRSELIKFDGRWSAGGIKQHQERRGLAYLAKMDFVKDDLVRMTDAPESREERENGDQGESGPVVAFRGSFVRLGGRFHELVDLDI